MDNQCIDGEGRITFLFAHGAGAGMDHAFMAEVAKGLAEHSIRVVRFNFPYMQKRLLDGKRRPPDRAPKLLAEFEAQIEAFAEQGPLVIGGKSMGGRMASHLSHRAEVKGIACLGFPFHPPGKPENYKGEHLADLAKPCLILQGERDPFGRQDEFGQFKLSTSIQTEFLPDGDHGFKPRKKSGYTEAQHIATVVTKLAAFIHEVGDEK